MRYVCARVTGMAVLMAGSMAAVAGAQESPPPMGSVRVASNLFGFLPADPVAEREGSVTPEPAGAGILYFGVFTGTSVSPGVILTNIPSERLPPMLGKAAPKGGPPIIVPDLKSFHVSRRDIGLAAEVMVSFGVNPEQITPEIAAGTLVGLALRGLFAHGQFYPLPFPGETTRRAAWRTRIYSLHDQLASRIEPLAGGGFGTVVGAGNFVRQRIDVLQIDLTAQGVDEASEEDPGKAICRNDDNDNVDSTVDWQNDGPEAVRFEDDLLAAFVRPMTDDATAAVVAEFQVPERLGLWRHADKRAAAELRLPNILVRYDFYVEGRGTTLSGALRDTELALAVRPAAADLTADPVSSRDAVDFTVFSITGPQFVPEFSTYRYTAEGPAVDGQIEVESENVDARIVPGSTEPRAASIRWGIGPQTGRVILRAGALECSRDIDTIQVVVRDSEGQPHVAWSNERGNLFTEFEETHTWRATGDRTASGSGLFFVRSAATGQNGIASRPEVELSGPKEHRGVVGIEVGFAQDVLTDPDDGTFMPTASTAATILTRTTRGTGDARRLPDRSRESENAGEVLWVLFRDSRFIPSAAVRTKTIFFQDTPGGGFPAVIGTADPSYDQNPRLRRVNFSWTFRLAVVARVTDQNLGRNLTPQAWLGWRFLVEQGTNFGDNDPGVNSASLPATRSKLSTNSHIYITAGESAWLELEGDLPGGSLVLDGTIFNTEIGRNRFLLDDR